MLRFIVRNKNGWEIDSKATLDEALDLINDYENIDEAEGIFVPDYYEIWDDEKKKVVWP